jgi:hypothetical protein
MYSSISGRGDAGRFVTSGAVHCSVCGRRRKMNTGHQYVALPVIETDLEKVKLLPYYESSY